ncbi:hypothetical protein Ancab_026402 [Ancistrocladus abbreviatus]
MVTEEDPRKSAAAAVAAQLTASTFSAQMLSYVLSSLAQEGVIGNAVKESSIDYTSNKKPKLENCACKGATTSTTIFSTTLAPITAHATISNARAHVDSMTIAMLQCNNRDLLLQAILLLGLQFLACLLLMLSLQQMLGKLSKNPIAVPKANNHPCLWLLSLVSEVSHVAAATVSPQKWYYCQKPSLQRLLSRQLRFLFLVCLWSASPLFPRKPWGHFLLDDEDSGHRELSWSCTSPGF